MSRIRTPYLLLLVAAATNVTYAADGVTASIAKDGEIILMGNADLIGLNVESDAGYLSSTSEGDFGFYLSNTDQWVALVSLPTSQPAFVPLRGELPTKIYYVPTERHRHAWHSEQLEITVGLLGTDVEPPALTVAFPFIPDIPEPTTSLLGLVGLAALSTLRKRRRG